MNNVLQVAIDQLREAQSILDINPAWTSAQDRVQERQSVVDQLLIETIKAYGLSVRQIPLRVEHNYEMGQFKEGDVVVEHEIPNPQFDWLKKKCINPANYRFVEETKQVFRRFVQRFTIPTHAGYWMCQRSQGTSTRMEWSKETDNLAPTLEESVAKFLEPKTPKTS